ncbi:MULTISPECIES: ATP-binding protein [Helicobacter]|uniref:ATP-binding protein n=1 Tax=Helicobacter TaxID=209 RepID=UPI00261F5E2B|nr:ATP-binding protein [Helicobacter sp. UBA3407]
MKLVKIKIENFRSYDNVEVELSNLSVIVGQNDVGKSTLLDALNIFFENEKPLHNDNNIFSQKEEIIITAFFEADKQMEIFLDSAESEKTQTTLIDEYLLDNNGLLQIKKVWAGGKPKNTFIVANYPSNWEKPLIILKINDLKKLIDDESEVNRSIKKEMRKYLFQTNTLEFKLQEIDVSSKDTDIISVYEKLKTNLPKYALFKADRTNTDKDSEVTNIAKAIAQNAVGQVEEKFEEIKQEVKNKIQEFSDLTLEKLKGFNKEIADTLSVSMQDKALETIFSYEFKSDSEIPLNKRGSGIKRLFLLSFFLADSERQNITNMIYAIEEPETSQHPNFQKMIIETLQKISQQENRQILITTHTPEIIKMVNKEEVIFIKKDANNKRNILQNQTLNTKEIINTLGILPYISYKGVMFIEGETDVKFFKKLNKHFESLRSIFDIETITLVPLNGGGNIKKWIVEAYLVENTNIKQIYFMDKDDESNQREKYQNKCENNKTKIIITQKREIENYFPIDVLEDYFKEKFKKEIFSEEIKANWDNEDIARIITSKTSHQEKDIKMMFYAEELWKNIDTNNMQGFDEMKKWFEDMRDFFEN